MDIESSFKFIISVLAIGLIFYAYIPYIISAARKDTSPHVYSWFIWGLVTAIAFVAQLVSGGGFGSFVSLFAAIACFTIFFFALRSGSKDITKVDTVCLVLGVAAIGMWLVTKDPLFSVILATAIDLIGFIPTVRKSWAKPYDELFSSWIVTFIRYVLSVVALSSYTFTTALYPASLVIAIGAFCLYLYWRRAIIPRPV